MCIGLPMQVIESGFGYAVCEGFGIQRHIDTLLVGEQPIGTWLLVFLTSAREVLTEDQANKISDALRAVNRVMENESLSEKNTPDPVIDTLFADLIDREPPKPASLLALEHEHDTND